MPTTEELVLAVLRSASGPLTADEIVSRIAEKLEPGKSPPKKATISNSLSYNHLVERVGRGSYAYLPNAFGSAGFRLPLLGADPQEHLLPLSFEWVAALRPSWGRRRELASTHLEVAGGPSLEIAVSPFLDDEPWLVLPESFWVWLQGERERGVDYLVLRRLDPEAARFALEGLRSADLDPAAVAKRDREVIAAAHSILSRARREATYIQLVNRLVASGIYHHQPLPSPLAWILFEQDSRFYLDYDTIGFREIFTPALRRLLADRFDDGFAVGLLRGTVRPAIEEESMSDGEETDQEEELEDEETDQGEKLEEKEIAERAVPAVPAQHLYRFRVTLQWQKRVWREIEILDNQTLEDLHLAIQRAFRWDNDHLYSFYLSGRARDRATEIAGSYSDMEPPYTHQVLLAELELLPGRELLYLFDYGDNLRHDVKLVAVGPVPAEGDFPRVATVHGEAPPQYRNRETWGREEGTPDADEEDEEP